MKGVHGNSKANFYVKP